MNKNEVKEILANINYPGFNRDIVSFGMVSGIEVKSDEVKIILSITSQNNEKKKILVSDIEKKLNEYFSSISPTRMFTLCQSKSMATVL